MSRYYPTAERLRELLAQRKPRHANIQLFYSGAPIRYWTSRWELCGGSFVENSIHTVDLLRYFHGDIALASAFYAKRDVDEESTDANPMNLPHAYLVNYRFASGLVANCTTSRCLTGVKAARRDVAIVSDSSLIEWSAARIVENGETVWEDPTRSNPFALQAAAFLAAVRSHNPGAVRSPYAEALNSLEAVLAANESATRGGELVRVPGLVTSPSMASAA
jgi:predicted dehydrogenase